MDVSQEWSWLSLKMDDLDLSCEVMGVDCNMKISNFGIDPKLIPLMYLKGVLVKFCVLVKFED